LNTEEVDLNVWTIEVKYQNNGTSLQVDSRTRDYVQIGTQTSFKRYMVNYFSMGEDARVGAGFEQHRTKNRYCNHAVYGLIGIWNLINCCSRLPPICEEL
jgi:diacylglycerol kinase (ATP)